MQCEVCSRLFVSISLNCSRDVPRRDARIDCHAVSRERGRSKGQSKGQFPYQTMKLVIYGENVGRLPVLDYTVDVHWGIGVFPRVTVR